MRGARGLVLALAVAAAGGAAMLAGNSAPGGRAVPQVITSETVDILVAARPILAGEMAGAADVRWQPWPRQALIAGSIQRSGTAEARIDPAPARYPILAGEPVVEAKLARVGSGGVMASIMAAGKRAVSVPIREETAAGGFIQPQDRVDVLLTRKSRDGGTAKGTAELLLKGAKVLAIGKALDGRNGTTAQLRTATLELTPAQARRIAGAQPAGEISLALVAAADNGGDLQTSGDTAAGDELEQPVRTMKFGRRSERAN